MTGSAATNYEEIVFASETRSPAVEAEIERLAAEIAALRDALAAVAEMTVMSARRD